ncbi:hypothetical protein DQP58_13795 [Mycobacterium colombiense]|uniref:Hemerythrin-like domain-containing protein n=1 Tax=Mycobacterium colombiense TaxID=339268 RepID=A0A329KF46_9MYCO|nr:hemerythrin domain-containing protein [Mycobacterium colombiense]RAU94658.1 hypothetical protein DQP58_13795 [Mycobacterium colombiense]
MPTDAFEMALVHRIFRKELEDAAKLVRGVQPGQRGPRKRVAGHIANVLKALHHHHLAEDELLWPKLHDRTPMHADDIRRMETEHDFIAKTAASVELRLAGWMAVIDSPTTRLAQARAEEALVCEIRALKELVGAHLSAEEAIIVPLINENLTDAEWHAATERGASFLSGRNMRFGLAFVAMAVDQCNADERRRFLAGMAPPQRLLVKLFARRAMTSYRASLELVH